MMLGALTAGCLWPTSLHDQNTTSEPVPPLFTRADPAFGQLPQTATQLTDLIVWAIDPNPYPAGNVLFIRLFKLGDTGPQSRFWTHFEGTLAYPTGSQIGPATELTGDFFPPSGTVLCTQFQGGGDLFAVVADQPFSDTPGMENTSMGLTSENHWELVCP